MKTSQSQMDNETLQAHDIWGYTQRQYIANQCQKTAHSHG